MEHNQPFKSHLVLKPYLSPMQGPIGVFDSGFGGLTVLKSIAAKLPQYDYLYLGDNARAPYGSRSFETVYQYTLECVKYLFSQGCPLVILACNTASAKALRTIQQHDLPKIAPQNRVLGVIRPTTEKVGEISSGKHVGVLGTRGTVQSESYVVEVHKFFPEVTISQEACPMWVPLIENNEHESQGASYFIEQHIKSLLEKDPQIDTIILGCTHYPLLKNQIEKFLSNKIQVLAQGDLVANSLVDYLQRHPEMETRLSKNGTFRFETTDDSNAFDEMGSRFFGQRIQSKTIHLPV